MLEQLSGISHSLCYEFLTNGSYAPKEIAHIIDYVPEASDRAGCLIIREDTGSENLFGMVWFGSNGQELGHALQFTYNAKSKKMCNVGLTIYPGDYVDDSETLLLLVTGALMMSAVDSDFDNSKAFDIIADALDGEVSFNGFKYYFYENDDSLTFMIEY